MDISIQPFRNNELSAICGIWNEHFSCDRSPFSSLCSVVEPDRMELFVQSKVYFSAEELLIARLESEPVGFIHLCGIPQDSQEGMVADKMGIAALCIRPNDSQDAVASALLEAARKRCLQSGAVRLTFRPAMPLCNLYVGLGPAGCLAGVLSFEERLCRWLNAAGYKPALPTTLWELQLDKFRVPGDRIQILVRRRSTVDRQLQEPALPWLHSCVLGHAEITAFHLFDRIEKRVLQEIVLWHFAPDLTDTAEKVAWLWSPRLDYSPEDAPVEIAPVDRLVFLLAEALRDLHREHVNAVRTVTHSEANQLHQGLQRLGFSAIDSGMVFEKDLSILR